MKFSGKNLSVLVLLWLFSSSVFANANLFKASVEETVDTIYSKVYGALEDQKLFVVFEPNIGKNIAGFSKKWGNNYNRNQLESIRSLVFCNAWYANEVSNLDPDMLGLCPMKITLIQKNDKTTVLFIRPSQIAGESPATIILKELEDKVINALSSVGFKTD